MRGMSQPILFGSWAPGQLAAELAAVRATQEQASAGTASPAAEEVRSSDFSPYVGAKRDWFTGAE